MKRVYFSFVLLVSALIAPSVASAQTDGYSNVAGVVGGGSTPTASPGVAAATASGDAPGQVVNAAHPASQAGSLPFTGLELGLVLTAGLLLLLAGVALRRAAASRA